MPSFHEILLRLLFAAAMGAAIGLERDLRRRPAGIRTSMFVCLATALFTILSQQLSHLWGDTGPTRIASNIVQGIGFLGAGAIIRDSGGLVGMTTAATIFVEAAIGMAAGGGFYAVAGSATGIVLFALLVVGWMIGKLSLKSRAVLFRFTTSHADNIASEIQRLLAGMRITVRQFRTSMAGPNSVVEFEAEVSHSQEMQIVSQLNRQGVVMELLPSNGHHE
ncbi:MAG TPA: MgtC/SapB family protein [Candidatus Sulfotelmatobacter sp.]|nr:MgtC/SapB family protein [Candidatus Sulfotelmatobacter sp.]